MFRQVAIIGVGMMGGSLGLALKQKRLAAHVIGVDSSASTLQVAQKIGAIDAGTTDMATAVGDADGLVFAAPVPLIPALMEQAAPHVRPDALVTDIGSTKTQIVQSGSRLFGPRFVGGHPMAGSERSGIGAADPAIFAGAAWAIVSHDTTAIPPPGNVDAPPNTDFVQRLTSLVEALGSRPIRLDAIQHDQIVALVSHLPHLLSFAFADTISASSDPELARDMAGGSFRDLARVAAADRTLWNGIFADNRAALLAALNLYEDRLTTLRNMIQNRQD